MSHEPSGKYIKHLEAMQDGARAYLKWYDTALVNGIISFQDKRKSVEDLAARMVDYRMGNIAKEIRLHLELKLNDQSGIRFLQYLFNDIALLCKGLLNYDDFNDLQQWSLLQSAGLKIRKTDLEEIGSKINEVLVVVGQEYFTEERLNGVKTWFTDKQSNYFYNLDYAYNRAVETPFEVGDSFKINGFLYPSAEHERISISHQKKSSFDEEFALKFRENSDLHNYLRKQYNIQPFLRKIPLLYKCRTVCKEGSEIYGLDEESGVMFNAPDELCEIVKGLPEVKLFGYWYRYSFYPLSLFYESVPISVEKLYMGER